MIYMRFRRASVVVLGCALALVSSVGCKKKAPEVEGPPDLGTGAVEEPLQVVAISPDAVVANQAVPARVMGAGFQEGASVRIGDRLADQVAWVDVNTLSLTLPALPDGVYDVTVQNPDVRERTLRAGLRVGSGVAGAELCRDLVVYFALDQAGLTDAARSAIDDNAACYEGALARIRVEGHADERGTTDYNLALGHRRAEAVRSHLVGVGVAPDRVETVSWGEERPADPAHTEAAWGRNRRAELHLEQ